jgi:hypothetical protein
VVLLGDGTLALKPKEYDLLLFLARHRGHVMTREMIPTRLGVGIQWRQSYSGCPYSLVAGKDRTGSPQPHGLSLCGAGYRFEG